VQEGCPRGGPRQVLKACERQSACRRSHARGPQGQFCPNPDCPAGGQAGLGNTKPHSHKERRSRRASRQRTFAATKGTPLYRLHKGASLLVCAVTLLAHGCPAQAAVAAFGLDERTVAPWQAEAGAHARGAHQHSLDTRGADLRHVQADAIYGKAQGGRCWLATAVAVPPRLWPGGAVSPVRDLRPIQRSVNLVRRAWRPGQALLICAGGLASYVTAFWRAFRAKAYTGRRGRPPYRLPAGPLLGQVIKGYGGRHLAEALRRAAWGSARRTRGALHRAGAGQQISTASIERLNATFRARLAGLVRRGRGLARKAEVRGGGRYLVGCASNSCRAHRGLRRRGERGQRRERTPALVAGWADHAWSAQELLHSKVPAAIHG
jgi:hypothetical protein